MVPSESNTQVLSNEGHVKGSDSPKTNCTIRKCTQHISLKVFVSWVNLPIHFFCPPPPPPLPIVFAEDLKNKQ
jgi:hypothetical protein